MTKTEMIVRLLKSALASTSKVSMSEKFDEYFHAPVPVIIDNYQITFWKRESLRRVESAAFPDGTIIDTDAFEAEHWLPSREEFPEWYEMQNDLENASDEQLYIAFQSSRDALKEATSELEKVDYLHPEYACVYEHFLKCMKDKSWAFERAHAYEPLHYLTESEQEQLEEILKNSR